jgi:hypothetical protein
MQRGDVNIAVEYSDMKSETEEYRRLGCGAV